MRTYVASKNEGKLKELREIFADSGLELEVYPQYRDVDETAKNYAANALLKALALYEQLQDCGIRDAAVLADDSGIELDALGGEPGVFSARYAPGATWPERLQKLLDDVGDAPDALRGVKFCCAMVLILPDGHQVHGYGEVEGRLAREPRGANGFGYDPVFFYPPAGKTFGEIPEAQKNRLSHRYNAARSLLHALAAL